MKTRKEIAFDNMMKFLGFIVIGPILVLVCQYMAFMVAGMSQSLWRIPELTENMNLIQLVLLDGWGWMVFVGSIAAGLAVFVSFPLAKELCTGTREWLRWPLAILWNVQFPIAGLLMAVTYKDKFMSKFGEEVIGLGIIDKDFGDGIILVKFATYFAPFVIIGGLYLVTYMFFSHDQMEQ